MLIRDILFFEDDIGGNLGNAFGDMFDPRNPLTYAQPNDVHVPRNDVTPRNPALSPTSGVVMQKDPMIQAPLDGIADDQPLDNASQSDLGPAQYHNQVHGYR